MKKSFFILSIILSFFFTKILANEQINSGTKFIVVGHIYPIINDEKKIKKLISKINSHKPKYVFILGDSRLNKPEIVNNFKKKIKAQTFFSPGNHDLKDRNSYKKNIGYFNYVINEKDIKFILVNSSESLKNLSNYLKENLKEKFENGPTIILTHHRIWDDTLLSQNSFEHDKSFYFKDIFKIIDGKVDAIFSGNSKRQYFRDLTDDGLSYGKQNINLIYWMDKVKNIDLYSIGMGDGDPKANFVVVNVEGNNLNIKGDYSTTRNFDILPIELISPDKYRLNINNTKGIREHVSEKYYLINKKKFILAIILILFIFLILIFRIFKKK
tara:strand:+ start:1128 stop:2108 length:981 start_codon:yes stop_codon:yes gene_type:complete